MAQIEREFQFLTGRILQNDLTWWALGHTAIGAFYALWNQRAHYAANPVPPAELKAVSPGSSLTMDEKERLATERCNLSRPDTFELSARFGSPSQSPSAMDSRLL